MAIRPGLARSRAPRSLSIYFSVPGHRTLARVPSVNGALEWKYQERKIEMFSGIKWIEKTTNQPSHIWTYSSSSWINSGDASSDVSSPSAVDAVSCTWVEQQSDKNENDVLFQKVTQAYSEKNPSAPIRSRT